MVECANTLYPYGTCKNTISPPIPCKDSWYNLLNVGTCPNGSTCSQCNMKCPPGYSQNQCDIKACGNPTFGVQTVQGQCYKDTTTPNMGKCTLGQISPSLANCRPGWIDAHNLPGKPKPSGTGHNNDYNNAMTYLNSYCFQKNSSGTLNLGTDKTCNKWCSADPASCDSAKITYCNEPANLDDPICGCVNRGNPESKLYPIFEALRSNVTSGNEKCWWIPCSTQDAVPNLIPSDVQNENCTINGTICANIINSIDNNNLNYNDVKQYINCAEPNPKPPPPSPNGGGFLKKYGIWIILTIIILIFLIFLIYKRFK